MVLKVKDDTFYVPETFVKNPKFMVGGCNIVQNADDEVALNGFSAPSCIF